MVKQCATVWTHCNVFAHSLGEEPLTCWHFGAIVNQATMNDDVQVFISLGYVPRNETARSCLTFLYLDVFSLSIERINNITLVLGKKSFPSSIIKQQ